MATGGTTITTGRQAEASYKLGVDPGLCALCFLGSLNIQNADYTVTGGGDIAVTGNATTGATGHFTAHQNVVNGTSAGNFAPTAVKGTAADPFASMTMPFPMPTTTPSPKTNPCGTGSSSGPGVYGAVSLPNGPAPSSPAPTTTSPVSGTGRTTPSSPART